MKGWLSPGRVFYACDDELASVIEPARDRLFAAGYIEVGEFHGLARFRGKGARLIDAWHKLVELAGERGFSIEKVMPSSDAAPSHASERSHP